MKAITLLAAALFTAAAEAAGVSPAIDGWTWQTSPLFPDAPVGEKTDGALVATLPSKCCCGWWETAAAVTPGTGMRFTAKAEIALDAAEKGAYNDIMMFVTQYDPKKGNVKGRQFYQRDFIRYKDSKMADGRILRSFDDTFAVTGECNTVRIELISKWHKMKVAFRDVRIETVDAPKPRKVRCVVGNPYEKWHSREEWDADPVAVVGKRLVQIEDCLTNIFAHVKNPDIILFAETFADTGSPHPTKTAERIPGGRSFELASRYAKAHRCYIAMCIRDLDPKWIGLEYDPMHALFEMNLSWTHGFNLVAPWIASIDLKDFHYALSPKNSKMIRKTMVAAGDGIVPWKEVRKLVESNGVEPLYIVHFEYDFDKSNLMKSVKSEMDAFKSVFA